MQHSSFQGKRKIPAEARRVALYLGKQSGLAGSRVKANGRNFSFSSTFLFYTSFSQSKKGNRFNNMYIFCINTQVDERGRRFLLSWTFKTREASPRETDTHKSGPIQRCVLMELFITPYCTIVQTCDLLLQQQMRLYMTRCQFTCPLLPAFTLRNDHCCARQGESLAKKYKSYLNTQQIETATVFLQYFAKHCVSIPIGNEFPEKIFSNPGV